MSQVTITKFHKGDLDNRNKFLMVAEIGKSKVKMLADLMCREGHLIGCRFFSLSFHVENKVEGSLGSLALTKVN